MRADPIRTVAAIATAVAATRAAGGGCYLGVGEGPVYSAKDHGVLVLGPPRSGKTTGIVVPSVIGADGPVLIASTKTDVLASTATARASLGEVAVFDPSGVAVLPGEFDKVGWSPVSGAASWERAVLRADAMVGASRSGIAHGSENHWNERASALLAPLLHAADLSGATMADVVRALDRRDLTEFLATLARTDAGRPLDVLVGIVETDPRELSGIFSTASSVLSAYRTEGALAAAERRGFDASRFCSSADTCYVVGTGEQQRHVAPVVAGFLSDLRYEAYGRAARGDTQRRILLVLDELANIAPLDDLPALVSEGASQGIITLACLQDLSQAHARWGAQADGFLSLFGTKVVLPGIGDRRTLEGLSLLAGDGDVRTRSVSGQRWNLRRSWTVSTRPERRVPPDRIANGPAGSAIVVDGARLERISITPAHRTAPFDRLVDLPVPGRPVDPPARESPASGRIARIGRPGREGRSSGRSIR